jgi:integrase
MGPRKTDSRRFATRVNPSYLESLTPGEGRYEVTDSAVPGLQLRVEPTGAKHWQLRYYWRGKRQKLALGTWPRGRTPGMGLAEARAAATAARDLLERGIDPRQAERTKRTRAPVEPSTGPTDAHSVPTLASEYLERHVKRQRKRPEYVQRFLDAEVLPADKWGARDARTITPREVVELLDGIVERGSPAMANRGAGILSQMFRFGVHRAIVDSSPVQLLYRPGGKEKPRVRALSEDELGAFLANVEAVMRFQTGGTGRTPRLAHVLRLLLLTGQRRGELALARWQDVTLTGKAPVWRIPAEHSKTGAPHAVPLSPAAVQEFRTLHKYANGSAWILPREDGKAAADPKLITRSVARNAKRFEAVGVQPFTAHDLRRTCRTGLARLKIPHDIAERILNHKLPAMREVYDQHEPLEEMRAALVKWAAHLAKL